MMLIRLIVFVLPLCSWLSPQLAGVDDSWGRPIRFEGTLLAKSKHPNIACGNLYIHQVAKYRVDHVIQGQYDGSEMIVDHPACEGDVFKDIRVSATVRVEVRPTRKYDVITCSPGIREPVQKVKMFYIAVGSVETLR